MQVIKALESPKIMLLATHMGKKFMIPLDFEMLDSVAPYYQAGLRNRLCYEITFNDYNRVIKSTVSSPKVPDAKYKITDISLEYEIVTQPDFARSIRSEYQSMALLYDRILRHRQLAVNKSDTTWNWSFNTPCKLLKGILVLFEEEKSYTLDTSKFYNPKIQKVSVTVEGKPNQLYAQGMRSFEQYDKICKYFAEGKQKDNNTNEVQKHLQLHNISVGEYLTDRYALWLDFRTIDENELHGTGRRIENASEGITLQIEKKAETAGALNAYIYLIMDAQLNIQSGAYVSAIYENKNVYERTTYCIVLVPTGVGKTHLALSLLENEYRNHFNFIVIICPTLAHNETYKS